MDSDDVESFEIYMSSKTLANSAENPWFEEYYQVIHQCYTSKTNTMGFTQPCSLNLQDIISSTGYQQDPGVVYVMNAVYAAAFGLHKTLQQYCGENYATVCQAYRSNVLRRKDLVDKLADVEFIDPVQNTFFFQDRQGVSNYRFNNIVRGIYGGANYEQIAYYNVSTGMVSMTGQTYSTKWKSDCDREDACAECPAIRDSGRRYLILNSSPTLPANATTVVAFFDVHQQGVDPYRCGSLNMAGYQQLLAFKYSVERLYQGQPQGTPGLRFLILDTCSNSMRVDQDLFGLLQGKGLCNTIFDNEGYTINMNNIGSVLTVGEQNTMAASRVLEALGVTYISPNAVSTALDGQFYLARTINPISGQMLSLVTALNSLGWNYVDVFYEDSVDGIIPWQHFSYYANVNKVCAGSSQSVASDISEPDLRSMLSRLSGSFGSEVVVLLGGEEFVRQVLGAAVQMSVGQQYVWLVASDWDFTQQDLKDMIPNNYHLRVISVRSLTDQVQNFNQAYMSRNSQLPQEWVEEFRQQAPNGVADCTESTDPLTVEQDDHVINTIAATYAVTDGLRRSLASQGTCGAGLANSDCRAHIRSTILSSTWSMNDANSNPRVSLCDNTDLRLKFNSMQWWNMGSKAVFYDVRNEDGQLSAEETELWSGEISSTPQGLQALRAQVDIKSECTQDEARGFCGCSFDKVSVALPQTLTILPKQEVRNYYLYNDQGSQRYEWPVWAIAVAVLTCIGIIVGVILFLVLLCAYPQRGGTSVLGYMAIVGILGIYGINFAFFVNASEATCGARRFLMGVVYMITIAPLLIKAIDNWRFGHVEYAAQRYSGISSALVLFLSACGVVLIQCIVPIMWLILVHPTATWRADLDAKHDNWWCDPPDEYDLGLVTSFIFVMFILLVTAIFSALAYDTDRNNYESRWILFACIATAGCFLVWMIVTTNAGQDMRDPAVAIANFVNATLLLLILPLRKSILMCRVLREKREEKEVMEAVGDGAYETYSNSYNNPTFELNDYDNDYVEG